MNTIASPKLHSKNEHAIVSLLDGECLEEVISIQAQLIDVLGDNLWAQEPPSLHITLMEVICDADYGKCSRLELFEQWYSNYNSTTQEVLSSFSPIDLVFDEILVSQRAIIIKTRQSDKLNKIRASLISNMELPMGTKTPPDITYSTLARFSKPLSIEKTVNKIKEIKIASTQHITEFSLVKDLGPPIFNSTPMQRYPLAV